MVKPSNTFEQGFGVYRKDPNTCTPQRRNIQNGSNLEPHEFRLHPRISNHFGYPFLQFQYFGVCKSLWNVHRTGIRSCRWPKVEAGESKAALNDWRFPRLLQLLRAKCKACCKHFVIRGVSSACCWTLHVTWTFGNLFGNLRFMEAFKRNAVEISKIHPPTREGYNLFFVDWWLWYMSCCPQKESEYSFCLRGNQDTRGLSHPHLIWDASPVAVSTRSITSGDRFFCLPSKKPRLHGRCDSRPEGCIHLGR